MMGLARKARGDFLMLIAVVFARGLRSGISIFDRFRPSGCNAFRWLSVTCYLVCTVRNFCNTDLPFAGVDQQIKLTGLRDLGLRLRSWNGLGFRV